MSRIGKKPIPLPTGVDAVVRDGSVFVSGPKGKLTVVLPELTNATVDAAEHVVTIGVEHPDHKNEKALWGLVRQLVSNAVTGVQKPYEKSLEFVGVGFKIAQASPRSLKIEVGFSHSVIFDLPEGIESKVEKQIVTLSGIDKQLVGETAARIRRIKPPEPYKGKGIKYTDEVIRRKAGKAATKGA